MSVTPQILNDAFQAYVRTFPTRSRLDEFITDRGLSERRDEIAGELDALLKTAEDYLWSFPAGVRWTDSFESSYRERLIEKHSWINGKSFDRIDAFSRWLCWHEGLEAK